MEKTYIAIQNNNIKIPAVLWGKPSDKVIIEIHGNLSNKEDDAIALIARKAINKGYQAISFDLPRHGERVDDKYECIPENCVSDFTVIYDYVTTHATSVSLFACSLSVYFSLLSYHHLRVKQSLFLSPIVNLQRIIENMMRQFNISENRLKSERIIELPTGQILDWDYYMYVENNPICFEWKSPTCILYGSEDTLTEWAEIKNFAEKYQARVTVLDHGEHYFHTDEHMRVLNQWVDENLF